MPERLTRSDTNYSGNESHTPVAIAFLAEPTLPKSEPALCCSLRNPLIGLLSEGVTRSRRDDFHHAHQQ